MKHFQTFDTERGGTSLNVRIVEKMDMREKYVGLTLRDNFDNYECEIWLSPQQVQWLNYALEQASGYVRSHS